MSAPYFNLGSLAKFVNGKAFQSSDWNTSGVPIIRIQNLNGTDKPFNYWAGPLDRQVSVKRGDLLLAWSGTPGTSFGAHIWMGGNAVLNQHIFRVDLDLTRLTASWAKFVINFRLGSLIDLAHGGVGLKHVTRGMVESLEVPVPPVADQRRIADVLDRAEALRAKRRAALAQLDTLTQAIFLDMFGDPARNPREWPLQRLDDILAQPLRNGLSPSHTGKTTAKVLTLSAITGGEFDSSAWKTSTFQSAPPADQSVDENDFLICRGNGNVQLVGKGYFPTHRMPDVTFPDTMIAARVKPERVARAYLQHVWNSNAVRRQVESLARTTTGTFKVNQTMIEGITFCSPPLLLQHEFARRASAVEQLRSSHRASHAQLDELFASLQHRAFRGEL